MSQPPRKYEPRTTEIKSLAGCVGRKADRLIDRDAYNAYMRVYMAKRRSAAKAEKARLDYQNIMETK